MVRQKIHSKKKLAKGLEVRPVHARRNFSKTGSCSSVLDGRIRPNLELKNWPKPTRGNEVAKEKARGFSGFQTLLSKRKNQILL
ncbi:hypothetical protein DLM75_07755 [Leptospira stimsonii]|uniref:Uncharacterized protein n=1 Tax=Leptospira stimsonii TaxID=2202203 RepID=A0A396ZFJ2_9LEPT|nr:hypothetical protein DLM75_07755 [Leptospira stimsonii]